MEEEPSESYDFTFVDAVARIALYDDLRSAPRITEIPPAPTDAFISDLATAIYDQARGSGGSIPYTVIREVTENFIHARFEEIVVTILERGNTIRFADQGPGISDKEKAQLPGFSSARESMKQYIRGVGSGLPIVKEYLAFSNGSITIEDNLERGSVVTLSMTPDPAGAQNAGPQGQQVPYPEAQGLYGHQRLQAAAPFAQAPQQAFSEQAPYGNAYQQGFPGQNPYASAPQQLYGAGSPQSPWNDPMRGGAATPNPYAAAQTAAAASAFPAAAAALAQLSDREKAYLQLFADEGELGVTEIANLTGNSNSTIHNTLTKMEESGLLEKTPRKKRMITSYGLQIAENM